jgi:hypothetical protein
MLQVYDMDFIISLPETDFFLLKRKTATGFLKFVSQFANNHYSGF